MCDPKKSLPTQRSDPSQSCPQTAGNLNYENYLWGRVGSPAFSQLSRVELASVRGRADRSLDISPGRSAVASPPRYIGGGQLLQSLVTYPPESRIDGGGLVQNDRSRVRPYVQRMARLEFLGHAKVVDLNLAPVEKVSDLSAPGDSRLRV